MRTVLLLLIGLCVVPAWGQGKPGAAADDAALYAQFEAGGASAARALGQVVKNAGGANAVLLYLAAGAAQRAGRAEDAGYLFYVAQLRARFDTDAFPSKADGGDNPAVLLSALSSSLGQAINPAIMGDPALFQRVLARVEKWEPQTPPGYSPGWEYVAAPEALQTARTAHAARKKDTVKGMRGLSTLLGDPQYFKDFRLVQRYNGVASGPRPTDAEYEAAVKRLEAVERAKKIAGPLTGAGS